jgi:hypothetical protein
VRDDSHANSIMHQIKQVVLGHSATDALCNFVSMLTLVLMFAVLTFHCKISPFPDLDLMPFQFCLFVPRFDSNFVSKASDRVIKTTSDALKFEVPLENGFCGLNVNEPCNCQ